MAALFERTKPTAITIGEATITVPDILGDVKTSAAAAFKERVDDELGLTLEEIQEAVADLARTSYGAYAQYKREQMNAAREKARKMMTDLALEYKKIGYTEDEAIKAAKGTAMDYYNKLYTIFRKIFPELGKEVKQVF